MSFKRGLMIGATMLAIGSFSWASAADPKAKLVSGETAVAPASTMAANKVMPAQRVAIPAEVEADPAEAAPEVVPAPAVPAAFADPAAPAAPVAPEADLAGGLSLVAPPAELPRTKTAAVPAPAPSPAKKTGSAVAAKPAVKAAVKPAPTVLQKKVRALLASPALAPAVRSAKPASPRQQVTQAVAPAGKPGHLFSYVRLLNYSPHPQVEEFLKDAPLALKGKSYWFSVKYSEGWKTVSDEEGYLQDVSFEITLMEGDRKVRVLKTPKVAIKPDQIAKGKVLGIAEVAPYKFTITVDQVTLKKKGVAELVFKLDLVG